MCVRGVVSVCAVHYCVHRGACVCVHDVLCAVCVLCVCCVRAVHYCVRDVLCAVVSCAVVCVCIQTRVCPTELPNCNTAASYNNMTMNTIVLERNRNC